MDTQDNGGIAYCDDRHGCHSADDVSSRKQQRKEKWKYIHFFKRGTAGVGENQKYRRMGICNHLKFMGVNLDEEKNEVRSEEAEISTNDSNVKVYVIPTNEELVIARDTLNLVK